MRRASLLVAAVLLAALALQLRVHLKHASPTIDEGTHLLAGYQHLSCGDFGINREHPPFAKLVAALPLRWITVLVPNGDCGQPPQQPLMTFFLGGVFLVENGIDPILIPARTALSLFTLLLGILVFLFARELYGDTAALLALVIFAFEPTLIAHGSLVTTDMPLAAMFFATVYAAHRYASKPTIARLLVTGIAAGLTLSVKHTGLLVLPIVVLLLRRHWRACAGIIAIAIVVLFATYGFQPAPYLDGIRYIAANAQRQTWIFDRAYPNGQWFYFPLAFAVKASIAVLVLAAFAVRAKERALLLAAPAFLLAVAMLSGINIGVRHILPLWPFLIVAGAGMLARFRVLAGALAALQIISALAAAPHSIAYANELWRAPHRVFKDSNVEWGQNTKLVRDYVQANGIKDCWFAAYGHGDVTRALQPCAPLPAFGAGVTRRLVDPIPRVLRGTVFLSATVLRPRGGPEYDPITRHEPEAILGGSIFVYRGEFDVPQLVASVERLRARQLSAAGASAPSPAPSAGSTPPARNGAAP